MAQASSRHPWQAKAMRRQRLPVGASKIIDENKKGTYNGSIDREPHGQVRLVFMRDSNVRPDTLVLPSHALQSAPPAPCGLYSWSGLVWFGFGLEEFGRRRRRRVAPRHAPFYRDGQSLSPRTRDSRPGGAKRGSK